MRALLLHPSRFLALSLAVEAAVAFATFGPGIEGLQAAARYSGRASLFWFALAFAASPWRRLAPSPLSSLAVSRRRQLGLAFGAHHLVHLGWLLSFLAASGRPLDPGRAAGGMLGYAAIVVMMATSSDAAVRRLGPVAWKRLHRTALWYVWLVFLVTYASRLAGENSADSSPAAFALGAVTVVSLSLLRVAAFAKARTAADPST